MATVRDRAGRLKSSGRNKVEAHRGIRRQSGDYLIKCHGIGTILMGYNYHGLFLYAPGRTRGEIERKRDRLAAERKRYDEEDGHR